MQYKIHPTHRHHFLPSALKWIGTLTTFMLLTSCGSDYPKLTQFKAFDERFNTVIDTKDPKQLATLSELFFDRRQTDDVTANLDFQYLFDVTTAQGSERWRCSKNGYCQARTEGAEAQTEIFYVERYKELYQISKLN